MASKIKDECENVNVNMNMNIDDLRKQINPWQYKLTNENEYDSEKIDKSATIILLNLKTDKGKLFELNAAKEISKYQKNDEGDDTESKKAMKKTEMTMMSLKSVLNQV